MKKTSNEIYCPECRREFMRWSHTMDGVFCPKCEPPELLRTIPKSYRKGE